MTTYYYNQASVNRLIHTVEEICKELEPIEKNISELNRIYWMTPVKGWFFSDTRQSKVDMFFDTNARAMFKSTIGKEQGNLIEKLSDISETHSKYILNVLKNDQDQMELYWTKIHNIVWIKF